MPQIAKFVIVAFYGAIAVAVTGAIIHELFWRDVDSVGRYDKIKKRLRWKNKKGQ
jgi:hypothetical protein